MIAYTKSYPGSFEISYPIAAYHQTATCEKLREVLKELFEKHDDVELVTYHWVASEPVLFRDSFGTVGLAHPKTYWMIYSFSSEKGVFVVTYSCIDRGDIVNTHRETCIILSKDMQQVLSIEPSN